MDQLRPLPTLRWLAALLTPGAGPFATRAGRHGLSFTGMARDAVMRHIAKYGAHEPELTAWMDAYLAARPADGIVVDVGANIGWHALHAARQPRVTAVLACEADGLNLSLLQKSARENGADKLLIAPWAISDRRGLVRFNSYKESNLGRHSVVADHGHGARQVPAFSLDETLAIFALDAAPIHLIKIDVEGYEFAVLDGAPQALARAAAVMLEFSPELMRGGGIDPARVIDPLRAAGFSAHRLEAERLAPLSFEAVRAIGTQCDLIWTR